MGFKRPLVRIQSLGPKERTIDLIVFSFLFLKELLLIVPKETRTAFFICGSNPNQTYFFPVKKSTPKGGLLLWWSRRSTSSDHQIIKGLHLLVSWRFFFAWMMCFYCVMCLCHYYLSFSIYSYLQFSIVQRKREQLRAVE